MEKHEKCWLCGSEQIIDLYKVNSFTVTSCKNCSLRFIREIVSDEYLKEFYTSKWDVYGVELEETAGKIASTTIPFLVPIYKILSKTFLKNIPFYKNYHDLITVIGIKTPHGYVVEKEPIAL